MLFFTEDGDLEEMIENPRNVRIKLISWLEINNTSLDARNYTYTEFSEHFTWHANGKSWNTRREKHNKISRIAHVSPAQGETYYLHMLLHIVKGAKSFSEIWTIAGHEYPTFRSTWQSLGLLGDDQEWSHALNDVAQWASPYHLRQLFVTILVFCEVSDPCKLFTDHSSNMSEDIIYWMNRVSSVLNSSSMENFVNSSLLFELEKLLQDARYSLSSFISLNSSSMENFVNSSLLFELEKLLQDARYSLSHFSLPIPDDISVASTNNMLILDELSYDTNM
jgi:hypothetical protein